MNDVKMAKRKGRVVYVAHGAAFAYMTSAIMFLLIIEAGDLRGAVEWKEQYSV